MVSDKFNLFSRNNSNKLPGKSEWKIFNDTNSSSGDSSTRSNKPQDEWLHVKKNDVKCKHSSYGSSGSPSSIKIPSNNDYYVLHKRAYKQEIQANKENKTRFPTTTGFDQPNFRNNNRDTGPRARSNTTGSANKSTSTSSSSTYKPAYQTSYTPYNSSDKRNPVEKFRANQGDVLMDWVDKMDP